MTHNELKKIRKEKKLTKGQFAALIGITAMMQGRYESGKIPIPEDIVKKVLALDAAKGAKEAVQTKEKDIVKDTAKAAAKKTVKEAEKKIVKDAGKKRGTILYIESQLGGRIRLKEILKRIPAGSDEVYVKPEENKAYWVKGDQTGDINLW